MKHETLVDIVNRSADRWPDRVAFRYEGVSLTYEQLLESAGRLASVLRDRGVERGDRVGVHLAKSLLGSTAVYGVMSAGGAYVPLDPRARAERIQGIVRRCGISLVVTESRLAAKISRVGATPVVLDVDRTHYSAANPELVCDHWVFADDVAGMSGMRGLTTPHPTDLSYIIFTSGSTGEPKGIAHTHASALAYATEAARLYGVNEDDRLSNHSPLHFDMSTFDYFSGPMCGATTVVIPEAHSVMPASMSKLIEDERLTVWYSVPLALTQMLDRGVLRERKLDSLRWVLFGGEPFPPSRLQELMRMLPRARFSNVYGPAEVNQCTFYNVPRSFVDEPSTTPVPLGTMWPAAAGRVVGEDGVEVPPGEVGELLVATSTMMSGYYNAPDLNKDAFAVLSDDAGETVRYYRTGDMVAVGDDGLMRFVGRRDRQIKIRGYRVELDEVERVLASHPDVLEAAAIDVDLPDRGKAIIGVVRTAVDDDSSSHDITKYARRFLPDYAMPARVESVATMPLTTSGKIDRRELKTRLSAPQPAA